MALENTGGTPNPDNSSGAGGENTNNQQPAPGSTGTQTSNGYKIGADGQVYDSSGKRLHVYAEDRTDFTPRHRLNEESGKRTAAEQRAIAAEAALEAERNRVRALAGLGPHDPKAAETEEVKTVLQGILKEMGLDIDTLKTLTKEELAEVKRAAAVAQSTSESSWNRHTQTAFDSVESEAAKLIGVQKLSQKQIDNIRRAYVAEADACMAQRENAERFGQQYDASNDFMARHLRGDATLFAEFAKAYVEEWATPIRRTVTSQQVRRGNRPVPSGGRSQDLTISNQPVGNLDKPEDFKKALLAARAANGG